MAFAGVPSPQERADILAYLRTLSDNPVPLPTAEAAAPPAAGGSNPAPAPAGAAAPPK
jgi:cytochrome c